MLLLQLLGLLVIIFVILAGIVYIKENIKLKKEKNEF